MGSCLSTDTTVPTNVKTSTNGGDSTESSSQASSVLQKGMVEVTLKRKNENDGGAQSGLFWRADPTGASKLASNNQWPREGAILRGHVIRLPDGDKWLIAKQVKQMGENFWRDAPDGAAVPFKHSHYYLESTSFFGCL